MGLKEGKTIGLRSNDVQGSTVRACKAATATALRMFVLGGRQNTYRGGAANSHFLTSVTNRRQMLDPECCCATHRWPVMRGNVKVSAWQLLSQLLGCT